MTTQQFKGLLISSVILGVGAGTIDLMLPQLLPEPFASAQSLQNAAVSESSLALVQFAFAIAILICLVASSVGLYLFRSWGRPLAVGTTLAGVALLPFAGAVADSGLASAMAELSSMLWGAVLAVAYFSSLSKNFKPRGA